VLGVRPDGVGSPKASDWGRPRDELMVEVVLIELNFDNVNTNMRWK
jgi:hypothetical protein